MRRLLIAFAVVLLAVTAPAQPKAHYRTGEDGALLPDPVATPGATFQVSTDKICTPGYAKSVRDVSESDMKRAYVLYGATK